MFQLRLFVHQRLYAAAEEILGQMENTITLVLHEADVRAKEEAESLRHQLKSGLGRFFRFFVMFFVVVAL